jgi:hypothetical protein
MLAIIIILLFIFAFGVYGGFAINQFIFLLALAALFLALVSYWPRGRGPRV